MPVVDCTTGEVREYTQEELDELALLLRPTPEMVDGERDRRIHGGITFAGIRFQTRQADLLNVDTTLTFAMAAIAKGDGEIGDLYWHGGASPFVWIAEDNSLVPMDAPTFAAFAAATTWRRADHILAARALKDMDPIPGDFFDDSYWPEA